MKVAVVQMNSTADSAANLEQASALLARAASSGASMAVLPEHFSHMQSEGKLPARPQPLIGDLYKWLAGQARQHDMWLVGGSFNRRVTSQRRVYNTCLVIDPAGELVAHYDKIHLFDFAIPGQKALTESAFVKPGSEIVAVDTELGRLGLSICYDLRFGELYRRLRLKGAEFIAAPSAFTKVTGQAHWELLVRTRAVENACFMLAAAQTGVHGKGRESYGQAMIVNPWGDIVAQCGQGVDLAVADIDREEVLSWRRRLDSTPHSRLVPDSWRS